MIVTGKIGLSHILPTLAILLLGMYFLAGCKQTDPYVLVPSRTTELIPGSPVLIEDVVVGEVKGIQSSEKYPESHMIRISLDREYSIPSNSRFRIIKNNQDPKSAVQIVVVASKSYLNPGDTVFFFLPEPTQSKSDTVQKKPSQLEYRIQIYASNATKNLDSPVFKGVQNVDETFDGTLYKYYTGRTNSLDDAKILQRKIKNRGIEDAFIVAFLNGERILLEQAAQYEN